MVRMTVPVDGRRETVEGTLLAQTSSRRIQHRHPGPYAPAGRRCPACRWTRVTIIRTSAGYAVISEGFSVVPGEVTRYTLESTSSPLWVIQCLQRRNRDRLSTVAKNALIVAAEHDEALAQECVRRRVG